MTARYGRRHHELRLRLLPLAYGTPCVRCGQPMLPSQALDLDHNDYTEGYKGFSHSECNRRAGGYKAHGWRSWPRKQASERNVSPQARSVTQW